MSSPHIHRGSPSFGFAVAMAGGVLAWQKMSTEPPVAVVASAIESLLHPPDAAAAELATTALCRHAHIAFDALLDELAEDGGADRTGLLLALARLPDERALPAVRHFASQHADPAMRRAAVAALGAVEDAASLPALRALADRDPALVVSQQAIVAIAEIGDDAVLADLAALLDPTTLPELSQAARRLLHTFTDRDFADATSAREWLASHVGANARTSVGGVGAAESLDLEHDSVHIAMRGSRVEVTLGDDLALPVNLILRLERGVLLVEMADEGGVTVARCRDLPAIGGELIRHAPVTVERRPARRGFSLPRVGQLAQPGPIELAVVHASR